MDENEIAISFGRWLATLCIFDGNNKRWLYCGNIKYYSTEEIFDIFMKETRAVKEENVVDKKMESTDYSAKYNIGIGVLLFSDWLIKSTTFCISEIGGDMYKYEGQIYRREEMAHIFMDKTEKEAGTNIYGRIKSTNPYSKLNIGDYRYALIKGKISLFKIIKVDIKIDESNVPFIRYHVRDEEGNHWASLKDEDFFKTKQELLDSL